MQFVAEEEIMFEKKLDELIILLSQNEFDNETIKRFQEKFNSAIEIKSADASKVVAAFKVMDRKDNASRDELINEFSMLLLSNKIDSKISSKYLKAERTSRFFLMLVGIVLIALGFAMIVMPAPPYFEMFTIYYITHDHGITLMDLISLAIIFSGIFIFIRSLYKKTAL